MILLIPLIIAAFVIWLSLKKKAALAEKDDRVGKEKAERDNIDSDNDLRNAVERREAEERARWRLERDQKR